MFRSDGLGLARAMTLKEMRGLGLFREPILVGWRRRHLKVVGHPRAGVLDRPHAAENVGTG